MGLVFRWRLTLTHSQLTEERKFLRPLMKIFKKSLTYNNNSCHGSKSRVCECHTHSHI